MFKCYVLGRLRINSSINLEYGLTILGELGDVGEFTFPELDVLCKFVNIIGYTSSSDYSVSVCSVESSINRYFISEWASEEPIADTMLDRVISDLQNKGYDLYGDMVTFNAELSMRFGIKALVTDRGRLVYCDPCSRKRIVLGDFCSYVETGALSGDGVVYVLDDRINGMSPHYYRSCHLCFDISGLSDRVLRSMVLEDSISGLITVSAG